MAYVLMTVIYETRVVHVALENPFFTVVCLGSRAELSKNVLALYNLRYYLCHCGESLFGLSEVDYIPNGREIIGFDVFVLKIERVFPNVDTNDGLVSEKRVLVGGSHDLQLLGGRVVAKPAPSTTLDSSSCSIEFALELLDTSKVANQGILEFSVS